MALHALKIVKEEFEIGREILKSPTAEAEMVLANIEHAISERIKKECIEQPESALDEEAGIRKLFGGTL